MDKINHYRGHLSNNKISAANIQQIVLEINMHAIAMLPTL